MKRTLLSVLIYFLIHSVNAQNSPFYIWGTGLDGSTYQKTAIYSEGQYGLLFEAPLTSSGQKLPIEFNWRGGGQSLVKINPDGNVGIGTTNPLTALQIGNFNDGGAANQVLIPGTYNFEQLRLGQIGNGNQALEFVNHQNAANSYGIRFLVNVDQGPGLQLQYSTPQSSYNSLAYSTALYLNLEGNIGIGTIYPTERLSVKGKIRAQEIKVENTNWPDYVFESSYNPTSLPELEKYIKASKHLPEIPSAQEVKENGVSLGEMNAKLLKKIEEITLYLIELKTENEKLKQRVGKLEDNKVRL